MGLRSFFGQAATEHAAAVCAILLLALCVPYHERSEEVQSVKVQEYNAHACEDGKAADGVQFTEVAAGERDHICKTADGDAHRIVLVGLNYLLLGVLRVFFLAVVQSIHEDLDVVESDAQNQEGQKVVQAGHAEAHPARQCLGLEKGDADGHQGAESQQESGLLLGEVPHHEETLDYDEQDCDLHHNQVVRDARAECVALNAGRHKVNF